MQVTAALRLSLILSEGKLEVDAGMLTEQSQSFAVDNFVHFLGFGRQIHALQLDFAVADVIVYTDIVVFNLHPKNHVVQVVRDIAELEGFFVDRVALVLLLARLLLSVALRSESRQTEPDR